MSRLLFITLISCTHFVNAQSPFPADVQVALNGTRNKTEIIKALQYFYNTGDSIKIKSVNFLTANMPIHSSYNYYWADSLNRHLQFNELDYSSFDNAVFALNELKTKFGKIHPVEINYRDIDTIKAETIIENIELAIKAYGVNEYDENFYEYVLPYRVSVEPLENWRKLYTNKFAIDYGDKTNRDAGLVKIQKEIKNWFANTYKIEQRKEPLPRLSALQLLSRAKGPCEDIAGVASFIARSQGYPATVDFIPAWATASGLHFLNFIKFSTNSKTHFDVAIL
jgi:Transglutaminase-like superfamily